MFLGTMSFDKLASMFVGTIVIRLCLVPLVAIIVCVGSLVVVRLKENKPREYHAIAREPINQHVGIMRRVLACFF
jgi:hypothetical protein